MSQNATRAPSINRRTALLTIPAVAVAMTPAAAAAAVTAVDPIEHHARELAKLLAGPEFDDGPWSLTIRSGNADQGIGLRRDYSAPRASRALRELIDGHHTAWKAFEDSCPTADTKDSRYGGLEAEAENSRLGDVEMQAMYALLDFTPTSEADNGARASYLLNAPGADLELRDGAVERLLRSMLA